MTNPMGTSRREKERTRILSERYGLTESEVKKIASSFFACVFNDAARLPFDNPRRIYSREKFDGFAKVRQIPYIGRIGPAYSKYLKWRVNESKGIVMAPRSSFRRGVTQSDIEDTAAAILSGQAPPRIKKRKGKEMFERVWLVGQDGKKSARQVIPKK